MLTSMGTLRTTPTWAPVFIAEIDLPMSNIHRKKGWKLCMSKDPTIAAFFDRSFGGQSDTKRQPRPSTAFCKADCELHTVITSSTSGTRRYMR